MARPRDPERPCPVCGTAVEPLRAPEVVLFETGPEYLCSAACRARYGETRQVRSSPPSASESSRRAFRPKVKTPAPRAVVTGAHAPLVVPAVPPPALGLALAIAGLMTSPFATGVQMGSIALILGGASALVAGVAGAHLRQARGLLAWLSTPSAALLALGGAALQVFAGDPARPALAATCVVAAVANVRWWLDALAEAPIAARGERLAAPMPKTVHPAGTDAQKPLAVLPEVEVAKVRVGEEIVTREGERVAVDGVVRAGDGAAHLHPNAESSTRRGPGDPVLAGARVTRGALRILATRVGADRSLLRPLRFGDASAADAAQVTRLAGRILALASFIVLSALVLGLALGAPGGEELAPRLLAAAAALVALPLLSLRQASAEPWIAAGLVAAERGIVFSSARALDRAGRVTTAVLCTRGTLTVGTPEVVEIHGVSGRSPDEAVALAAAAEAALPEGRLLGAALLRWARGAGASLVPMRRVQPVAGRGLRAQAPSGDVVLVGNRQLLLEDGVSIAALEEAATAAEARGQTVLWIAVDGKARALVALRDEEHPGARAAVQRLIDLGVEAVLLTGDQRGTATALARSLGVEHVKAELTPEERTAEVRRMRDAGGVVAVIGRAENDEEVLVGCDVPIVLGAAGSASMDRGAALAGDDARDAAAALWIAHATRRDAVRGAIVAAAGGTTLCVLGALGFLGPGVVAILAVLLDAWVLPLAGRLVGRIDRRLPVRG